MCEMRQGAVKTKEITITIPDNSDLNVGELMKMLTSAMEEKPTMSMQDDPKDLAMGQIIRMTEAYDMMELIEAKKEEMKKEEENVKQGS